MAEIKNKLNGGIELLAKAIQQVFDETMSASREAVKGDLSDERRLNEHIDERADRTDTTNVQSQLASIGKTSR